MRLGDLDALEKEAGKLWEQMPDGEELSKELMKAINHAPTVDAVPVKHGRWVFGVDSETGERDLKAWTCSECNEKYPWQPNYCPNCGAKMSAKEDGEC